MDRAYRIEAASVVSDVIDGEAVMLHRGSGDYFSTDGVGCLVNFPNRKGKHAT